MEGFRKISPSIIPTVTINFPVKFCLNAYLKLKVDEMEEHLRKIPTELTDKKNAYEKAAATVKLAGTDNAYGCIAVFDGNTKMVTLMLMFSNEEDAKIFEKDFEAVFNK